MSNIFLLESTLAQAKISDPQVSVDIYQDVLRLN